MLSFPNAKINLGLHVLNKRPDGFHNLETCFYPVPWKDIIEIIPSGELTFSTSGISIPDNPDHNLCLKAWHALAKDHTLPPVHIHLHKNIPIGAGLGGGSADAAFVVKLLNERFSLNLTNEEMEAYVRPLGSDCAFFIQNKPVMAHEKGDVFTHPGVVSLSGWWIYIIYPPVHISTKEAYEGILPDSSRKPISTILSSPVEQWKDELVNDFEKSIFTQHPSIRQVKDFLYEQGAVYASMSGSGSSVFGLFKHKPTFTKNIPLNSKTLLDQLL